MKFLVLLLGVAVIALSAALFLRGMMISDFRQYIEGEREDRVTWVISDLERTYEQFGRWNTDVIGEDAVWALMLGFEVRVRDSRGGVVMDTEKAVAALSPQVKRRVLTTANYNAGDPEEQYHAYPLFMNGAEIGRLEVKFLTPKKENIFIERSNRFLLISFAALGGLALALSIIISLKLTRPIKKLAAAAESVSEGDLKARVPVSGKDEIGKLSETFNKMTEVLETQEDLRKKLLSNTAHELRTPVGAIRGELEGMMDGFIPTDKEQIKSLYDETDRIKRILDGMEELAQAQASALALRKQTVDLESFLNQIMERIARSVQGKDITFKLECEPKLSLSADPDRLSQVMINLLNNSVKAVVRTGAITVTAATKDNDVLIVVADTGTGIKPVDFPHIFERFYRGSGNGLGLGLPIVKELVEAHGGRIEVGSEWGKGTVLTVRLPSA